MEIQHLLDSDITMCLDECTPHPATHAQAAQSMRMSMRWAARCRMAFQRREGYALFGIIQGSTYPDLRTESAAALAGIGFNGYGIGRPRGRRGAGGAAMLQVLDDLTPQLAREKPRYLMGVGKPGDLVGAVLRGVDMFDCVMPTPLRSHGAGLHPAGHRQSPQRASPRRRAAAGCQLRLPDLHRDTAVPICTTCSAARKCWAPCC